MSLGKYRQPKCRLTKIFSAIFKKVTLLILLASWKDLYSFDFSNTIERGRHSNTRRNDLGPKKYGKPEGETGQSNGERMDEPGFVILFRCRKTESKESIRVPNFLLGKVGICQYGQSQGQWNCEMIFCFAPWNLIRKHQLHCRM